ncbi:hypothetical protein T484DRAFT_1830553 [Baffinella frigidus]|nr:hypothetical protein T484DRAFT_1830553 [Cryptophyta sp. CCMP2293]
MEGVLSGHPEGLMQRILGWLEVRELGRCSRTCRAWSQAGSSDELWEALHVRKQRHVQNAGACGLWQSAGRFTISDRGSTLKQLDIPCPAEPLVPHQTHPPSSFIWSRLQFSVHR